jgi:dienelactone hydrolase
VNIHGGPFGADYLCWNPSWYDVTDYYCQEGAFVLSPNYHGSSNYGLEFAESIANGKYYEYPIEDIENGIDDLIAKGLVDGERIGLKGWSNGAILTLALIAQSPRYKAAASGAGGAEWTADWASCAFGDSFGRYYFGGTPLQNPDLYRKLAPIFDFNKVTTPTIIFHGDIDTAVPTLHGWMQFRALQSYAKTDVRFVLFPGEEHSIRENAHKMRKVEEEAAWFAKYLFGKPEPIGEIPVARPGTQLERLIQLSSAANDGDRFGVTTAGTLLPEMVEFSAHVISKFEITRAQFAEFKQADLKVATDFNFPATNITFDDAKNYAVWLSKMSGEEYSLVDSETADDIYGDADPSQNTLDYWAGYPLNPEDAKRALDAVAGKSLLMPVGSFPGEADPNNKSAVLFDLNGNAAEWIIGEDGEGELRGGSADMPIDPMNADRQAGTAYRGFRVMKAAKK